MNFSFIFKIPSFQFVPEQGPCSGKPCSDSGAGQMQNAGDIADRQSLIVMEDDRRPVFDGKRVHGVKDGIVRETVRSTGFRDFVL